jgi:glutathione S-transferase
MSELVFYTNPMSRGRIIRWMLEEVGQPYRTELLDYGTTMKAPAYLAVNPMGKVPAIKHGDVVVTEAAAICAYLADAFPQAGLAPPASSPLRGPYYRWLFFGAGPVEQSVTSKSMGWDVDVEKRGMVGFGCMDDVLNALERAVEGRACLVGDQLGWGMQFGTIEKRPAFEAYVAGLYARPAAQKAAQIDDALMPAPQPEPAE